MNIKIGEKINKIKIELFKNIVPKTSENFRCLCTGEKGDNLNYKGKIFDKLIKNFIIQGGKIDKENNISIYGKNFENENYYYSHSREGLLSMANKSYDSNGSEFFITLKDSIWLDGKNVVFGQIIEGINIIKEFNNIEIDNNDTPKIPIIIDDCGEILKNNI
jgi:cyclophilin family peptidyl-prolyl cis-trans isomerase